MLGQERLGFGLGALGLNRCLEPLLGEVETHPYTVKHL
jgi:hypothetical protein